MKKFIDRFYDKLLKRNVLAGIIILVIAVVAAVGLFYTKVNSDIFSYLPKDADMSIGLDKMSQYFGINSNMLIAIQGQSDSEQGKNGATLEQIKAVADEIKGLDNISAALWYGDVEDMLPNISGVTDDALNKAKEILVRDDMYLIMVNMEVSAASDEAKVAYNEIKSITSKYQVAYGGTTPLTQNIYADTFRELPWYVSAAFILVLIILVLTARNFIEPIIFITTLGVSILLNMGTNLIFGEISIVSYCAAAVLQLGLAMDYAIFLTHMYYEEREKGLDVEHSIKKAIPKTFSTITASALTTVAGMATLFAMRFTIGGDLARVIIKGICFAWLSVLLLQPCLIMWGHKAMEKTQKKPLNFHFEPIAKAAVKRRKLIVIIALLLIAPCFVGQLYLKLNYVAPLLKYNSSSPLEAYANSMNTAIFVCAPVDESSQGLKKQYKFVHKLEELESEGTVTGVTGLFAMLDENIGGNAATFKAVKTYMRSNKESSLLYNNGYALYIISLNEELPIEGEETSVALSKVRGALFSVFDTDSAYISGTVQGVSDFETSTPRDFLLISILSAVSVLIVLILTFRSIKYPIMLVLLIELGIWINYSLNAIFGAQMNFVSYLAISAVQLGATVDYAILLTKKYRNFRSEGLNPLEACFEASRSSSMSILTSASIMMVACLSVGIIASNQIIKEVGLLVARGAVISCILVLFVLPSLLACSERLLQFVKDEGGVKKMVDNFVEKATKERKNFIALVKEEKSLIKAIKKGHTTELSVPVANVEKEDEFTKAVDVDDVSKE